MRVVVVSEDFFDSSSWRSESKTKSRNGIGLSILWSFSRNMKMKIAVLLWLLVIFVWIRSEERLVRESVSRDGDFKSFSRPRALRGMGTMISSGIQGFNKTSNTELIVAHLTENVTESSVKTFIRMLFCSGALAKADVVFLFHKHDTNLLRIVEDECAYGKIARFNSFNSSLSFSFAHSTEKANLSNLASSFSFNVGAYEGGGVGAVMGFEMEEMDPANILRGFFDEKEPPAQIRRWACYPLLLGTLRHRYKSIGLVKVGGVAFFGDVLKLARKSYNGELFLFSSNNKPSPLEGLKDKIPTNSHNSPHHKRKGKRSHRKKVVAKDDFEGYSAEIMSEDKRKRVNSDFVMGSSGHVRALCNAMLNEIVKMAMQKPAKVKWDEEDERAGLSYLVHVSSVLGKRVTDKLQVLEPGSLQEVSFVSESIERGSKLENVNNAGELASPGANNVNYWNSNSLHMAVLKALCSSPFDKDIYPECNGLLAAS